MIEKSEVFIDAYGGATKTSYVDDKWGDLVRELEYIEEGVIVVAAKR